MNPVMERAMQIAVQYGRPAADAFIRQFQAGYAAMRNAPQLAPKGATGPFAPSPVLNPNTGYKIQYPIQHSVPALRGKTVTQYSPTQVYGARAAAAAPVIGLGVAGAASSFPESMWDQLSASQRTAPTDARRLSGETLATQPEPGYEGSAGRRLSGEMLAMQPEPGYDMPPAARAAISTARNVMPSNPPLPPRRPAEITPAASGPSARDLWERYNESESPADFVRADMAMRAGRAEGGGIPEGMMGMRGMQPMDLPPMSDGPMPSGPDMGSMPDLGPSPTPKPAGAGAGGRDAAINKALEIIHHLVIRRP